MMQSIECGPNKYKFFVTSSSLDYHKNMLVAYLIKPFTSALHGLTDNFMLKLGILITSLPALFALNLFATPSEWWKGLIYLVVIDWLSGIINAIYRKEFDWDIATSKWYQVVSYVMVCGAAAILSNTFNSLFWYFQYVVYATFFIKETVSILKTFRLLALFRVIHKITFKGKQTPNIGKFIDAVEKEFENKN